MLQPINIPLTSDVEHLARSVNFQLNNLIAAINSLKPSSDQDANGRRITNLGNPSRPTDAATVEWVEKKLKSLHSTLKNSTIQYVNSQLTGLTLEVGTHAERLLRDPLSIEQGSQFYESDRDALYQVQGGVWQWVAGCMRGTLSPDQKPSDLGTDDANFLFYSTDFQHIYRWDGSAWAYATECGEIGSAYVVMRIGAPATGVWQLCDGSTVTRSTSTGGTSSITVPNLVNNYPKGSNAYTGAVVAATAPTISGNTGAGTAHTHGTSSLGTDGQSAGTPSGSVSSSAGAPSLTTAVQSGVGATVAASNHSHSISSSFSGSPLGTHAHNITGSLDSESSHTHPAGTLAASATGEPSHVNLLFYIRL